MFNLDFESVQEQQPVKNGRYDVIITEATVKQSGPNAKVPGADYINLSIGFPAEPNAPNIWHMVSLPNEHDEKKSSDFKTLLLKRLAYAFKASLKSGDWTSQDVAFALLNCQANLEVRQVMIEQGSRKGEVANELVIPKLPNEGSGR